MMIGGSVEAVQRLDPVFKTLAPGMGEIPRTQGRDGLDGTAEQGYLHCGPSGAGHFVKMVHNGIEYGVMAAYAGGLAVLRSANIGKRPHEIHAETTPLREPDTSTTSTQSGNASQKGWSSSASLWTKAATPPAPRSSRPSKAGWRSASSGLLRSC